MIWIWLAAGLVLLPFLILSLRVHFSGRASNVGYTLRLKAFALRLTYDSTVDELKGRIFGFATGRNRAASPVGQSRRVRILRADLRTEETGRVSHADESTVARTGAKNSKSGVFKIMRLVVPSIPRLLRRLLRIFRTESLDAEFIVATGDPMSTAIIFGALQPVQLLNAPNRHFSLGVDFERSSPRYQIDWSIHVRPIVFVWVALTWGLSLPLRKLWRLRRRS